MSNRSQGVLVTGGMGFIGSAVTRRLARSFKVTVADRLDFGLSPTVQPLADAGKIEFIETDLAEPSDVHHRIESGEFFAIVHLAALTHIPLCEKHPDFAYRSTVISALNVISRLSQSCRFINFSTSSTYAPEDKEHVENTSPLKPIEFYGWAKKHVEDLLYFYSEKRGLSAINIRLANAGGYGETNPKLIGTILQQIHGGADTVELGNLTPRRDFIHIDDIAWVIEQLVRRWPVADGAVEVINLGSGYKTISVEEVFEKIATAFDREIRLVSVEKRRRKIDRELLCVNVAKLMEMLPDYKPKHFSEWITEVARDPGLRIHSNIEQKIAEGMKDA
jgi:UDP-glucose 4-epimerase